VDCGANMPFEPWKRACLLACVLWYAAGATVPAGDGEGGPDDALVWGEEIAAPHASKVGVLFRAMLALLSRNFRQPSRFASVRVFRSADTRTPVVLWAGTLRRCAAGGSTARLEDAPARGSPVNPRACVGVTRGSKAAHCRPLVWRALKSPPVTHAGGSCSETHAVRGLVLCPARAPCTGCRESCLTL
jgi:hypothetical protein